VIRTRTALAGARRDGALWRAELQDRSTGERRSVAARALLNAAGPWVEEVVGRTGANASRRVRLVQGSHIVHRQVLGRPQAYSSRTSDKRVCSRSPTRAATRSSAPRTSPFRGRPADVAISAAETAYLLGVVNRAFKRQLGPADIVHSYSGVRPLHDDATEKSASAVTRDYVFDLSPETPNGSAPPSCPCSGARSRPTAARRARARPARAPSSPLPAQPGRATPRFPEATCRAPISTSSGPSCEAVPRSARGAAPPLRPALRHCRLRPSRGVSTFTTSAGIGERFSMVGRVEHLVRHEWARARGRRSLEADEARPAHECGGARCVRGRVSRQAAAA
jgi:glycerol-3-phosphate dehydrogenase